MESNIDIESNIHHIDFHKPELNIESLIIEPLIYNDILETTNIYNVLLIDKTVSNF